MPAESRENPLLKKGNSDAFFKEKYLTKNSRDEEGKDPVIGSGAQRWEPGSTRSGKHGDLEPVGRL